MPLTLIEHFSLIEDEYAAALKAPLSARQAMLVAVLVDKFADRVFAAFREADPAKVLFAEDGPAYRALLRQQTAALAAVFELCGLRAGSPKLVVEAVEVPIADYPELPVEDFMVSLYNRHTVQRVLIRQADGSTALAHKVLGEAVAWWRAAGPFD